MEKVRSRDGAWRGHSRGRDQRESGGTGERSERLEGQISKGAFILVI